MSGKLEPVYVPADDVDIYGVEEEGWYVVDETFQVFSGPFTSHKDCLGAIKETDKPQAA